MSSGEQADPGTPEGSNLVIAGRIPELDAAVASGDREKAIAVLGRAGMTDRVPLAVDAIFARPEDFGYPNPSGVADKEDDDWEEDEPTRVQFTLTVISDDPIDECNTFCIDQFARVNQTMHTCMTSTTSASRMKLGNPRG